MDEPSAFGSCVVSLPASAVQNQAFTITSYSPIQSQASGLWHSVTQIITTIFIYAALAGLRRWGCNLYHGLHPWLKEFALSGLKKSRPIDAIRHPVFGF